MVCADASTGRKHRPIRRKTNQILRRNAETALQKTSQIQHTVWAQARAHEDGQRERDGHTTTQRTHMHTTANTQTHMHMCDVFRHTTAKHNMRTRARDAVLPTRLRKKGRDLAKKMLDKARFEVKNRARKFFN